MDSVTQRLLSILGFPDGIESLPSMRQLKTQYRRTSLKRHPDKPGGTKGHFQELLDAFEKVGNLILNMDQSNLADDEETKARKEFKEFNFTKKNTFSFTIYVSPHGNLCSLRRMVSLLIEQKKGAITMVNSGPVEGSKWMESQNQQCSSHCGTNPTVIKAQCSYKQRAIATS